MKNFSQKFLIALFLGLFLGGCSLEIRDESTVNPVDYTIYDNLDTVYRTIDIDGVHETTNQTMLTFNMDNNILAISTIGNSTTNESYTMEILSEDGATNATFQLHGSGRYNGKYLGMSLLTNTDGSFLKFHIQDRETILQETTSDMIYYNYASDSMIFRHHKKHLNDVSYRLDGVGAPVVEDSFVATINDAGEYLLNDEKIDTVTTTIQVLNINTPATEIMTKSDGGYSVIQYSEDGSKFKKLEVESYADISRSSIESQLVTAAYYQDFGDIYKVANEILAEMSKNTDLIKFHITVEIDSDYYISELGCYDVQFTGTDVSILCTGIILGTATFDNIVANSTLTINGDNYKYIKYTLTEEECITELSSYGSYADRDMLLMVKTDVNGNFTKDSEMLVHLQIDERFYISTDDIGNVGGSESWTVENSAKLFAFVDKGTALPNDFNIRQYFNYNMPIATKPLPVWIETVYNNTYNGKYITFSADATEVYVGHTQEGSQNQTTYTYKYYNAIDCRHVYENGGNTISFDSSDMSLYDNAQTMYYISTDNSRVEATIDNVKDKSAVDKDNTDRTFQFSADGDSVEYKGKKYYYNRSSDMFIDYRYGLNESIAFNTFTDTGGKYSYKNNDSREYGTFTYPTVVDEILAAMYGQTLMAQQTVLADDGKYYADQENTIEYSQRFTDAGIELWVIPNKSYNSPIERGTATEANIVKYGSLTTSYGDTYKYIKYTYTSGQIRFYNPCGYTDRDMIIFAKVDASGKVTADSEVFVHLEQTGYFLYFDGSTDTFALNSTTAYGGNQNIDLATSKKIFDYIDGGAEVDLRPYFNFNMPSKP